MTKVIYPLLFLVAILCAPASATTYYTISEGDWNQASNWSLTPNGGPALNHPTSTDNVVIRHDISQTRPSGYTFYGNITVNRGAAFRVLTGNGVSEPYIFGGDRFELFGKLISSSDFQHQVRGTDGNGLFYIGEYAILEIGDDLILNASGSTIMENASCGSGAAFDDLYFVGEQARICGNGSFIVPDKLRSWLDDGTELTSSTDVNNQISSQMCTGFTLYGTPGDCDNNDPILVGTSNFSLPVEWLDVKAEEGNRGVDIQWSTSKEINNDYFQVEKSEDGILFTQLGQLNGQGNSDRIQTYSFVDQTRHGKKVYYRIKQVDFDGQFDYSSTIEFTYQQTDERSFDAFPNPSRANEISFFLSGDWKGNEQLSLMLMDMSGRILHQQDWNSQQLQILLPPLNLQPGVYTAILSSNQQRKSTSIVITR
ncbi:MAG: T9SS type A sorting domain-containing protein [Bacteroidota bacterium]